MNSVTLCSSCIQQLCKNKFIKDKKKVIITERKGYLLITVVKDCLPGNLMFTFIFPGHNI